MAAAVQSGGDARRQTFAIAAIGCFWFVGAFALLLTNGTSGILSFTAGIAGGALVAASLSGEAVDLGLVPAGFLLAAVCSWGMIPAGRDSVTGMLLQGGVGFSTGLALAPLQASLPSQKGRLQAAVLLCSILGASVAWGVVHALRDLLSLSASGTFAVLGLFAAAAAAWASAALPDITVRFLLRTALASIMRVRVEGSENIPRTGGVLLVSNHISYADSVVMGSATPRIPRFLIWQPIFNTPVVNFFFRVLHAIPIATESPKSTITALRKARAVLESGEIVAIFPEGAISRSGEIEPFLRGFERIVYGLDVPIVPIHIDGLWGHPMSLKGGKLWGCWERAWWPVVTVRVGEPIYGGISPADLREIVVGLAGQGVSYAMQ